MRVRANNASGGGGGSAVSGDGFYDNNNTYQTETADGQDMRIETGLSTVKRFILMANPKYSSYTTYKQVVEYDADVDSSNYGCCCIYGTAGYGGSPLAIGTQSNAFAFRIMSISGGTVTLKAAANTYYGACNNIRWFAE